MINVKNILSTVLVVCSIGCIEASNSRVDFQFNDDQNGFSASAQYNDGYIGNSAYATDMRDFASRVNQNLNGNVSFTEASRETFNLDGFTNYVLKPNKLGMYEYLGFNGFKCNRSVNKIGFHANESYQPSIVLNFDKEDDANLPIIDAEYIPIIGFEVKNPTGKGITLRDFNTNGVTGLSYNVPMYIQGCKCNNTSGDFRRLSVLVEDNKNSNDCSKFTGYNGEKSFLGRGMYLEIPGLELKNGLKIVKLTSSVTKPSESDIKVIHSDKLSDIIANINQKGKFAIDFTHKPQKGTRSRDPDCIGAGLLNLRNNTKNKKLPLVTSINDVMRCNSHFIILDIV